MIELGAIPYGMKEVREAYGNPDMNNDGSVDLAWWERNMVRKVLPYAMRASWDLSIIASSQYIHRAVADAMIDALTEIAETVPPEFLQLCDCDILGGVYNLRTNRRSGTLSMHSFGIAIDLNPHLGPLGGPDNQPEFIKRAFLRRGFVTFPDDTQHYQAAKDV